MSASALFAKLNLKTQSEILLLNAPPGFEAETGKLEGVQINEKLPRHGPVAFTLAFVTKQAEVDALAQSLADVAEGDAILWFAYPKQSSKRYRCDFNRDTGWAALGALGFESVRMVAIDEDWSALRFRRTEFIKTIKRDSARVLSASGRPGSAGVKRTD